MPLRQAMVLRSGSIYVFVVPQFWHVTIAGTMHLSVMLALLPQNVSTVATKVVVLVDAVLAVRAAADRFAYAVTLANVRATTGRTELFAGFHGTPPLYVICYTSVYGP